MKLARNVALRRCACPLKGTLVAFWYVLVGAVKEKCLTSINIQCVRCDFWGLSMRDSLATFCAKRDGCWKMVSQLSALFSLMEGWWRFSVYTSCLRCSDYIGICFFKVICFEHMYYWLFVALDNVRRPIMELKTYWGCNDEAFKEIYDAIYASLRPTQSWHYHKHSLGEKKLWSYAVITAGFWFRLLSRL